MIQEGVKEQYITLSDTQMVIGVNLAHGPNFCNYVTNPS